MSALAEGSLEALKLALWLWGSCVVSATPWVERERGGESERETEMLLWLSGSKVVAARACSSGAEGEREGDSIISETNVVECQFGWGDCNLLFILNVRKCAICIQLQHLLTWIKIMAGKLLHVCHQVFTSLMSEESKANRSVHVSFTGQNCLYTYTSVCIKMSL